VYWPHEALRSKSRPVEIRDVVPESCGGPSIFAGDATDWTGFEDETGDVVEDMIRAMRQHRGIGLAANQVGEVRRIIVVDVPREHGGRGLMVMFNPEVVAASTQRSWFSEGCLSFLDNQVRILRPSEVDVSYVDHLRQRKLVRFTGLEATCVQHEIDHIDGITIIHHADYITRSSIEKKMQKMRRRSS
jgi:peptide deformylase